MLVPLPSKTTSSLFLFRFSSRHTFSFAFVVTLSLSQWQALGHDSFSSWSVVQLFTSLYEKIVTLHAFYDNNPQAMASVEFQGHSRELAEVYFSLIDGIGSRGLILSLGCH